MLEFDHPQREPVDERHDVQAAAVLVFYDGELVDGQPVVAGGMVEVEDSGVVAADSAGGVAVLDGDASTSIRWKARLWVSRVGSVRRVNLRRASSRAVPGWSGLRRETVPWRRDASTTSV